MSRHSASDRATQGSEDITSSEDEIARKAAIVAVTSEGMEAFVAGAHGRSTEQEHANVPPGSMGVAHDADVLQNAIAWKDRLQCANDGQALDGTQIKVATQLDKILATSLEFTAINETINNPPCRASDVGRLFQDATPSIDGQFTVVWQSEYSALQTQTPEAIQQATRMRDEKRQQFRRMKSKHAQAVAVSGDQVVAYAALAACNAKRKMRPVSKQENLGPKCIVRCGWGGGKPVLEALSLQHKRQLQQAS